MALSLVAEGLVPVRAYPQAGAHRERTLGAVALARLGTLLRETRRQLGSRHRLPRTRLRLWRQLLSGFCEGADELRARGYTELRESSVQVRAHRTMRQIEALPDLAIG